MRGLIPQIGALARADPAPFETEMEVTMSSDADDARDQRMGELMTELLTPPDAAVAHAVRMARTRDLVAELEALSPGALDRLQSAAAALQLRRLGVDGARTH